jgi:hypothetical protein
MATRQAHTHPPLATLSYIFKSECHHVFPKQEGPDESAHGGALEGALPERHLDVQLSGTAARGQTRDQEARKEPRTIL